MTTMRSVSRGKFLSALIILMAVAITTATLALIFVPGLLLLLGSFPVWFNLFLGLFLFARLIALAAIWNFKRWGVYAFGLLECVEVFMGLFVFASSFSFQLRLMTAPPSLLVILTVWYLALKPKWPAFT